MLPPLSIICPTYGRTSCLRELVECYKRCEYDGELELFLLNDVPEQLIVVEDVGKEINAVNLKERMPSLGDKRNSTVRLCKHEHFLFVDDDDIFLPWYPQDMMVSFLKWGKPTYPNVYIRADGRLDAIRMSYKPQTHPASYLATKEQFEKVNGYPFVYVGGDQLILSRLFKEFDCHPNKHPSPTTRAGYVYRWGNGTYHISGSSDHATAWDRTLTSLQRRLASGEEPTGVVEIKPQWDASYSTLAAQVNKP